MRTEKLAGSRRRSKEALKRDLELRGRAATRARPKTAMPAAESAQYATFQLQTAHRNHDDHTAQHSSPCGRQQSAGPVADSKLRDQR